MLSIHLLLSESVKETHVCALPGTCLCGVSGVKADSDQQQMLHLTLAVISIWQRGKWLKLDSGKINC